MRQIINTEYIVLKLISLQTDNLTMTSLKCSVFQTVMNNYPCGDLEIYRLVTTKVFKQPVEQYRKSLDRKTKVKLPAFTPSGIFQRRRADSLIEPSNIICIDIDGKDNPSISNTDEMKKSFLSYRLCGIVVSR